MAQNINKQINSRNYDILDLAKFILAFLVVAIHTSLYPKYLYPWLRIAVPLFFIISSFLFFKRLANVGEGEKVRMLIRFVKRNLTLYLSWFVILLPFTIYFRRWWFDDGIWTGVLRFLGALFFGSTFRASWYITALIISVVMIFFLSQKINNWVLLFFSTVLYCLCCLSTNYRNAIIGTPFDTVISFFLSRALCGLSETFFSAMFWIVTGKMFAETKIKYKHKILWLLIIIFGILLYVEFIFVQRFSPTANDNYFSLMLFCPILFATLLLFDNVTIPHSKELRKYSTIIYVTHCNVAFLVSGFMSRILHIRNRVLVFLITALICYGISIVIVYLSKKERFRFLNKLM